MSDLAAQIEAFEQLAQDVAAWQQQVSERASHLRRQAQEIADDLRHVQTALRLEQGRSYTEREAAAALRVSVDTLQRARAANPDWPHYLIPGCNIIFYSDADLAQIRAGLGRRKTDAIG